MVTYWPTLSTAQLTHTQFLSRIGNNIESNVSQNFWNALEVAQRVDESSMLETVQQLVAVLDAHNSLKTMIQYHAVTEATSMPTRLQRLSENLFHLLESSIRSSRVLHAKMNSVYEKYVDYLVTDVTSAMQRADILYAQVMATFVTNQTDSEQIRLLVTELESVANKLAHFDTHLNATAAYASNFFPKRLMVSTTCRDAKRQLNSSIVSRTDWLAGFPSTSKFDAETDLRMAFDLSSLLSRTTYCMQAYKVELDSFSKWLDSVLPPAFVSSSLSASWSDAVNMDGEKLLDLLQKFISGSLTKSELAKRYLTDVDKVMENNAKHLVSEVQHSVFNKISKNIAAFEQMMESCFRRLFSTYVRLQKYIANDDTGIEDSARQQLIWRKPVVDFHTSEVSSSVSIHR